MPRKVQIRDAAGKKIVEWVEGSGWSIFPSIEAPTSMVQPSRHGYEVPLNGATIIDNDLRRWTLVGTAIHVDGQPYKGGLARKLLMWNGVVWHNNPNRVEWWITETETGWSEPGTDPRVPVIPPVTPPSVPPVVVQPPVVVVPPPPVVVPPTVLGFNGQTRGSINGNIITVADSMGFRVGDPVILPAEQERGQDGPGGGWPDRRGSQTQLNSLPEGSYIADPNTGLVWQKENGVIVKRDGRSYYDARIVPKAYLGVIQSINGNKWTMDRPCVLPVSDVDVFYDGAPKVLKAIQDAPDGRQGALTKVNLNALFPGFKRVAFGGSVVPQNKKYVEVTCDVRESFEVFAPKGAPGMAIQFRNSVGCRTRNFTIHGNHGDNGFGFGWEGSTGVSTYHGFLKDVFVSTGQMYLSGLEFWDCDDSESHDHTVIDVPIGAWRCERSRNCWGRRIYNRQNSQHRNYVQWQFHYASSTNCGTEDCVFDGDTLTPAFEGFHSTGGGHIRPVLRNGMMAMNNAGGWRIESPRFKLDAGCEKPLEGSHGFWQYGTGGGFGVPLVNINCNAEQDWAVAAGGTMTDVVIEQPEYLDSRGCNLIGISVQPKIVNFVLDGLTAIFPAKRVSDPKYGGGAVGLQCYGPGARLKGQIKIVGECINSGNNYSVYTTDADTSGATIDAPPGSKSINWKVS